MDNDPDVRFSDVGGILCRQLLDFCLSGRLPPGQNIGQYEQCLRGTGYAACLFLHAFRDVRPSLSDRAEMERAVCSRPFFSAQICRTHAACLALLPRDGLQGHIRDAERRLGALLAPEKPDLQGRLFHPAERLAGLPGVYDRFLTEDASPAEHASSRFSAVVRLYGLENDLYDSVLEADLTELHRLLQSIAVIVSGTDGDNLISQRGYFCFLWRSAERNVFQRIGRRKTSADKLLVDEALVRCRSAREMAEVTYGYLAACVGGLQLEDRANYHKLTERVRDYIREQYADHLTLEAVAREAGVSPGYLSKLFRRETGVNFKQYLTQIRMERARTMLLLGRMNIAEVGRACGYGDAGYFCRLFRSYYGVSPKNFQTRA